MPRRPLLPLLALAAAGCAATGPKLKELPPARTAADGAIVYVYRAYAEPTLFGASLEIDGKDVVSLSQKGFTRVVARPGQRHLKAGWNVMSGQRDATISLDVEAGKTYYVELVGVSSVVGTSGSALVFKIGSGMVALDPVEGEARLARCCHYQPPAAESY